MAPTSCAFGVTPCNRNAVAALATSATDQRTQYAPSTPPVTPW